MHPLDQFGPFAHNTSNEMRIKLREILDNQGFHNAYGSKGSAVGNIILKMIELGRPEDAEIISLNEGDKYSQYNELKIHIFEMFPRLKARREYFEKMFPINVS